MVKCQIEGSNDDEILRFCYPRKDDETRNPIELKFGLKIWEKSLFQNQKKSEPNLGENKEQFDLNEEIKSNLNNNCCKINDWFTLLTRLTKILGSKSRQLECICSVFSSAYVQRSRGEFDQILQRFVINPASIRSELSLRRKGIMKNSRFMLQTCLISSRFNQELRYKEEEHRFIREIAAKIADRPIRWRPIDSHDRAIIVGHDPTIPQSPHLFPVRWSHMSRRASQITWLNRDHRIPLILWFAQVYLMAIRWTRVHAIYTS